MTVNKSIRILISIIEVVRELDPEMKIQTLDALLRVAASGQSGIPLHELQRKLKISLASTSRNVSTLSSVNMKGAKAWGFVEQRDDLMDRRYKNVFITPKGTKFVHQVVAQLVELFEHEQEENNDD